MNCLMNYSFIADSCEAGRLFSELSHIKSWRRSGLMVSAFVPGARGLGSSPGRGHCVVILGKTLNSHGASLHPGV